MGLEKVLELQADVVFDVLFFHLVLEGPDKVPVPLEVLDSTV